MGNSSGMCLHLAWTNVVSDRSTFSKPAGWSTISKSAAGSGRLYCPVKVAIFRGLGGGPQNLIFIGILLFLLLRNPCKNLKSYDNPFWGKSNAGKNNNKKYGKIPKI